MGEQKGLEVPWKKIWWTRGQERYVKDGVSSSGGVGSYIGEPVLTREHDTKHFFLATVLWAWPGSACCCGLCDLVHGVTGPLRFGPPQLAHVVAAPLAQIWLGHPPALSP